MISKEASQLMSKLTQLKTTENKQAKQIKDSTHGMIEYEAKVRKWLAKFEYQLQDLEGEIKTIRDSERREEESTLREIDGYGVTLRTLLNNYQKEASKASLKLSTMVGQIKSEMTASLKQSHRIEKESVGRYKTLSTRLDSMIELVRGKQKRSMDDYEVMKDRTRTRINCISEENQRYVMDISSQSERLLDQLDHFEQRVDQQTLAFIRKFDSRVFQTNKVINSMVQYETLH